MNRREKRAYRRGIVNTLQFLAISGFYTFLLCEIVTKLF